MTHSNDVVLRHPHGEHAMAIVEASEGTPGIDASGLPKASGLVALDNGFVNTASCKSAITYIDGDAGILRYRPATPRPTPDAVRSPPGSSGPFPAR